MALDENVPLVSNQIATDLIAMNANWEVITAAIIAKVSDTVYGAGWNGVTTIAPSKNAVYDKIAAIDTFLATISGITAYGISLIDDANAGAALTTLGITAYAQTILDDANAATAVATLGFTATAAEVNTACDGATAKNSHTHAQAAIENAAIGQAQLKTSQGSVNTTLAGADLTLPGGEYGFYPQVKVSAATTEAKIAGAVASTSYVTNIYLNIVGGSTAYAQQRYVTASGEVFWLFILRDKLTGDTLAMWQAPDHPCFGNGGKPSLVQHPFNDYDETKHEIIVINPSHEEVEKMKKECERGEDEPDLDLLELIASKYEIDEKSEPVWPTKAVTVGLPKDYGDKAIGEKIVPIKKAIPRPSNVLCKSLIKKE